MLEHIQETAAFLKAKCTLSPKQQSSSVEDSGSLAGEITEKYESNVFEEIPNFPVSTVEGHSGKLIFGKLGRQGHHGDAVTFPFLRGLFYEGSNFPRTRDARTGYQNLIRIECAVEVIIPTLESVT